MGTATAALSSSLEMYPLRYISPRTVSRRVLAASGCLIGSHRAGDCVIPASIAASGIVRSLADLEK